MPKKVEYPKMDPKWKAKWVEALRSGEYKQGRHSLKDTLDPKGPKYCCLGVLCDIHTSVKWSKHDPMRAVIRTRRQSNEWGFSSDTGKLPTVLREKVGISKEAQNKLVSMNDQFGSSHKNFKGIADWIEKNL